jgi:hypothetical protein
MYEEDPQLALSRPANLTVGPPVTNQQSAEQRTVSGPSFDAPRLTAAPPVALDASGAAATPQTVAGPGFTTPTQQAVAGPSFAAPRLTAALPVKTDPPVANSANPVAVSDLSLSNTDPTSITSDQKYVNKVVRSLAALRSVVVSRRQPPVLNERSYR